MNKTVALVNEWASFEAHHPEASIEDFCRHYVTTNKQKKDSGQLFDGILPPTSKATLMKLLGRISRLQGVYANAAMTEIGLKQVEDFYFMNAIAMMDHPRKTEVIYNSVSELSTGLNILSSLKERGFISEEEDREDRRSRRLALTDSGREALERSYQQMQLVNGLFFHDMQEEDLLLCIQLLKNVEIKFAAKWQQQKGRPIKELYEEMTGEKI